MWSAMANADVFGEQLLRHILAFVPRSSELAKQYSFQPKTEHYLVKTTALWMSRRSQLTG